MNSRIVLVLCLLVFHIAGLHVLGDEATDAEKVLIPGHCQDAAGRLLPNVRVRLVRWKDECRRDGLMRPGTGDVSLVQETKTDSIGRFWLKLSKDEALLVVKREHLLVLELIRVKQRRP